MLFRTKIVDAEEQKQLFQKITAIQEQLPAAHDFQAIASVSKCSAESHVLLRPLIL